MKKVQTNTIKKALIVEKLVKENYEEGRQDRCKLWVLRNIINEVMPISTATFFRYLKIAKENKIDNKK